MLADEFNKYTKSQEFKDLLARYEQVLLDNGNEFFDANDLLDIAEYYYSKHDVDAAIQACYYCLDLYPDNDRALVFIARSAIFSGDYTTAERIAKSIKFDEELEVVYLRAELMLINSESDKAEEYLTKHFLSLPEDDDQRYDMALDVPHLYCDYSCWQLAEKWLQLLENDGQKEEMDYVEAMARIYANTDRHKEAIPYWNKYIDENSFSSNAWISLAQCQYQTGQCQEALQSAEYAIAINPDMPDGYLAAGNAYFAMGRGQDSIDMFEKFLDLLPGDAQGELLLSCVYFSEGKNEEAKVHIDNAINAIRDLTEDDVPVFVFHEIYRQAAFVYGSLGEMAQANTYVDYLLFYGMEETTVKMLRAAVYLEGKHQNDAFTLFSELLDEHKNDPKVYIKIGMMLVDSNYFALGYKVLGSTLVILEESGMPSPNGWDRLAYAALMENQYDDFLEALEKSIEYLPTETVTIFSPYFPDDMPIEQYLAYAKEHRINP